MNQPHQIDKQELRQKMKQIIASIPLGQRKEQSDKIIAKLLSSTEWKNAKQILLYAPTSEEIDVWPLLEKQQKEKDFFLPKINPDSNTLEILSYKSGDELKINTFGIKEPRSTLEISNWKLEIDLILVPGLAFTKDGKRLGRGGGYYDRLLENFSGTSIGLCFSEQVVLDLPTEAHDRKMSMVLSG